VKGSPIQAGVNGKNVFGPVFSSGLSGAFLSVGFKDLDPSLLFHRSISDASPFVSLVSLLSKKSAPIRVNSRQSLFACFDDSA